MASQKRPLKILRGTEIHHCVTAFDLLCIGAGSLLIWAAIMAHELKTVSWSSPR